MEFPDDSRALIPSRHSSRSVKDGKSMPLTGLGLEYYEDGLEVISAPGAAVHRMMSNF